MTGDAQETPLERLRKGSETGDFANWNRWRELSNHSTVYLEGADLRRIDFGEADLSAVCFRGANLVGANLGEAILENTDFTDANLEGARLPKTRNAFNEEITSLNAVLNTVRTTLFVVLGYCAFLFITAVNTNDLQIALNNFTLQIPTYNAEIPVSTFFVGGAIVGVFLFIYLHIFLSRVWSFLQGLPNVFPDGTRLGQRLFPSLVSFVLENWKRDRKHPDAFGGGLSILRACVAEALIWFVFPVTLAFVAYKYFAAHNELLSNLLALSLILSVIVAGVSYMVGQSVVRRRVWRSQFIPILLILTVVVATPGLTRYGLLGRLVGTVAEVPLTGISLPNHNFGKLDLENRDLSGSNLAGSDLRGVKLKGANLSGVNLRNTRLDGVDLTGAKFERASLAGATLNGATLSGRTTQLTGVDFAGSSLSQTNFIDTNLSRADIRGSNASNADFTFSDLVNADLTEANLAGINASHANFSGASLDKARLPDANLKQALFVGASVREANLSGTDLTGAILSNADLTGADFWGAKLTQANLAHADLRKAKRLTISQLRDANTLFGAAMPPELCKSVEQDAPWLLQPPQQGKFVDHGDDVDAATKNGLDILKQIISDANIPAPVHGENITLATWNIRNFGGLRRMTKTYHYIAEIIGQFDIVALTEVQSDLSSLRKVLNILGPNWQMILGDVRQLFTMKGETRRRSAIGERIAVLYDRRFVEFTGLAAEANEPVLGVLEEEKIKTMSTGRRRPRRIKEWIIDDIWFRSPVLVSFRSGNFDFVIVAVHIRYGRMRKDRIGELQMLAEWISDKKELGKGRESRIFDPDMIVLGDFNVGKYDGPEFDALVSRNLRLPSGFRENVKATTLRRNRVSDLILVDPNETKAVTNRSGILDFLREDYVTLYPESTKSRGIKRLEHELSDHFPVWIQLDLQATEECLDQFGSQCSEVSRSVAAELPTGQVDRAKAEGFLAGQVDLEGRCLLN